MKRFLWFLAVIGAVIGALIMFFGVSAAKSAPQEAAIAAIGIASAVIPYCLARAVAAIESMNSLEKYNESCPECKEVVRSDALKCKHCGATLTPTNRVDLSKS